MISAAPVAEAVLAATAPGVGAAKDGPRVVGYLASVRNVDLLVSRLDDVPSDLVATAELVTGDERTVLYDFSVSSGARTLLGGRATIVFTTAFGELLAR